MKNWDIFNRKLSFIIGNGRRVKFWNDRWCIKESL